MRPAFVIPVKTGIHVLIVTHTGSRIGVRDDNAFSVSFPSAHWRRNP